MGLLQINEKYKINKLYKVKKDSLNESFFELNFVKLSALEYNFSSIIY
jgi:hypothetical protein